MVLSALLLLILGIGAALFFRSSRQRFAHQELSRFRNDTPQWGAVASNDFFSWLRERLRQGDLLEYLRKRSEDEKLKRLLEAGLDDEDERERYLFLRGVCIAIGPALGAISFLYLPMYYATIVTLIGTGIGVAVPLFWLRSRTAFRNEDIQRELPLLLDLVNLGTSAGWDLGTSLDRVVEALGREFPNHPLFSEFRRAVWLTSSGYTWDEALTRIADKLDQDVVRRTTMALSQALRHGGERVTQLEAIAEDAQRVYYAELDKRLASLPVKSLLITMMLMIGYFIVLLAPTTIQVKNVMMG